MPVKIWKIVLTAVAVEAAAILLLVLIVAIAGPSEQGAAQAFAARTGIWFGPLAGFVLCVIGGWFVSRNLSSRQLLNGVVLGVVVAAIDIGLLVASGSEFQMVFVVSNIGRVIAGTIGGWIAGKRHAV